MEDEVRSKLSAIENRLEDFKTFFITVVSAGSALFGIISLVFAWTGSSDKADLKADLRLFKTELKNEVEEAIGQIDSEPKLSFYTENGESLEGAEIIAMLEEKKTYSNGKWVYDTVLKFPFVIKNEGKGWSGKAAIKAYTSDDIVTLNKQNSTDEPGYTYETYWMENKTQVYNIPGDFSYGKSLHIYLDDGRNSRPQYGRSKKGIPQPGKYPILLKIYYGDNKIEKSKFTAVIQEGAKVKVMYSQD